MMDFCRAALFSSSRVCLGEQKNKLAKSKKLTSLHRYLCANFECSQTGLVAVAAPRDYALPVQRIYSKKN